MTNLSRVRTVFSAFPGGPGVATMYFLSAIPPVAAVHSLWDGIRGLIPGIVKIDVEAAGDIINDVNGDLVSSWSAAATAQMQGVGGGNYAAPVGGLFQWTTGTVLDSHRVKGRNFLVPLNIGQYQDDGSLIESCRTTMQTAASAFLTATTSDFVVWHRPLTAAAAAKRVPPGTAHDGGFAIVTGSSIPDRAAVLRSRRD